MSTAVVTPANNDLLHRVSPHHSPSRTSQPGKLSPWKSPAASTSRPATPAAAAAAAAPAPAAANGSTPSKLPLPPNAWQISAAAALFGHSSNFNAPAAAAATSTPLPLTFIPSPSTTFMLPLSSTPIPIPSTPKSTPAAAAEAAPSSITSNPSSNSKGLSPRGLNFEADLGDEAIDAPDLRSSFKNTPNTSKEGAAAAADGKSNSNSKSAAAAATDSANNSKSDGKDGKHSGKKGGGKDDEDGHEEKEREEAEQDSLQASAALDVFKMDTTSPKAAIRSIILMQNRISSLLLPAAAEGHEYELRDIDHPCRVVYDGDGQRLPLHSDMPSLIWRVASFESLKDFDANERSTVLLPHWIFPTRANNQCVAETMLLITDPDLIIPERDAATALPKGSSVKEVKELRAKVVAWMDAAATGCKDYAAAKSKQFLRMRDAFAFTTPADAATEAAFTAAFEKMKETINSDEPLHTAEFAQVIAFMEGYYIEECRYRALSEPLAIKFIGDFDAAQGIVDSNSKSLCWRPDLLSKMKESNEEAVPHYGNTAHKRGAFVQYSRHPSEDSYTSHVIPMFPAPNYLIPSVNHPLFRLDPVRWVPLLPSKNCRFFATVCHVLRESPPAGELSNEAPVHFARSGSLYTETSEEETKTFIVVHTWIKLGSTPFTHAKQQLEKSANSVTSIMKKRYTAGLKLLKEFEEMELGALDKYIPTAMVTLVRIGNLGKDISVDDLQAELDKLNAADANIEMKRMAMDDLLTSTSTSTFEEINGPGDPTPAQVFVVTAPDPHSQDEEKAKLRKLKLTETGLWKELIFPDAVIGRAVQQLIDAGLHVPAAALEGDGEDDRVQTSFDEFLKSVADNAEVFFVPAPLRHLRRVWTHESAFEGLLRRDALMEEANTEDEDAANGEEEEEKKVQDNSKSKKTPAKISTSYVPPSSTATPAEHKAALDRWLDSLPSLLHDKSGRLAAWKTAFKGFAHADSLWKPMQEEFPVSNNNVSTAIGNWLPILARDDPQAYAIPAFQDGAIQLFLNDSTRAWASSKAMPLLRIQPKHAWFSNPSDNKKGNGKSAAKKTAAPKKGGGGGSAKHSNSKVEKAEEVKEEDEEDEEVDLTQEDEEEVETKKDSKKKNKSKASSKKASSKKGETKRKEAAKKMTQADETAAKLEAARKQHTPTKTPSKTTSNGSKRISASQKAESKTATPVSSTATTPSLESESPKAATSSKSSSRRPAPASTDDSPSKKQRRKERAEETKQMLSKLLEPMIADVKLLKSKFLPISSSSTPPAAPSTPASASSTPASASSTPASASSTPAVSSVLHEHARQFANGDPLKYMQFLQAMNAESDSKKKKNRKDKKRNRRDRSRSRSSNSSSSNSSSPRRRSSSSRSSGYMMNSNTHNPGIAAIAMGLNSTANSISQLQGYVSAGAGQLAPALPLSFPFHYMRNN